MPKLADHQIVDRFIQHLAAFAHPGLQLSSRPDKTERNQAAVDAVAEPFAIEHTSIGTFPNQRQENTWAREILGDLQERVPERIEGVDGHDIVVCVHPGMLKKAKQQTFFNRLAEWINDNPALIQTQRYIRVPPEALSSDLKAPMVTICHDPPGAGKVHCFLGGEFRNRSETVAELAPRLKALVEKKAPKLMPHADAGRTRVLLVENGDLFHMNSGIMLDAVFQAYPETLPPGIDQFWYVETTTKLTFFNFTETLQQRQAALEALNRGFNGPAQCLRPIPSF